jgi:hypothetical protein
MNRGSEVQRLRDSGVKVQRFRVPRFQTQPRRWPEKRPVKSKKKL